MINRTNAILGTVLVYAVGALVAVFPVDNYNYEIHELEKKRNKNYKRVELLKEIIPFIEKKDLSNYNIKLDNLNTHINSIDSLIADKKQKRSQVKSNTWKSWYTLFE